MKIINMAIFCETKACDKSTMSVEGFQDGLCDKCHIMATVAEMAHKELLEMNEGEPMDGDETEMLSKIFLEKLNELNGNK
jgi:hypothetical protein